MKSSDSLSLISPALVKAQGAFTIVDRTKRGHNNSYSYAPLDQYIVLLLHRSGQWITSDWLPIPAPPGNRLTNVAQEMGMAVTYAKRYALCAFLGLSTADEDTDAATPQQKKGNDKPQQPQQKEQTYHTTGTVNGTDGGQDW